MVINPTVTTKIIISASCGKMIFVFLNFSLKLRIHMIYTGQDDVAALSDHYTYKKGHDVAGKDDIIGGYD